MGGSELPYRRATYKYLYINTYCLLILYLSFTLLRKSHEY